MVIHMMIHQLYQTEGAMTAWKAPQAGQTVTRSRVWLYRNQMLLSLKVHLGGPRETEWHQTISKTIVLKL